MNCEMREIGSQSHQPKLAERMRRLLSTMRTRFQPRQFCSFQNVVVNNEADLWIIKRLARANDELVAINRMMPAHGSTQAESL
jgi:hypothetical protein